MLRGAGVFAGMLVRRAVAAKRDATRLARAQMNPACADLHALGAFANLRLLHGIDAIEMSTTAIGHKLFAVVG